jgi:hypothetical protein
MNIPESFQEFLKTQQNEHPPELWPSPLHALWYDAKGDWNASHDIAQDIPSDLGYWIHAYLHRKEGDKFNADYWYRRANRPYPNNTLQEEFRILVDYVINS